MSLLDFLQSASNAVAGNVTGPVDLITLALRKAGVPVPEDAVGTSAWAKGKGLVRDVEPGAARVAGETAGILGPMLAVHYAPQIARSLLKAAENAAAPRTLNPQTGAIVWHGSPHKFDKFDSSKIGTGEGAQAYGHGLYFAESPDVANSYVQSVVANSDELAKRGASHGLPADVASNLIAAKQSGKNFDAMIDAAKKAADNPLLPQSQKLAARRLVDHEMQAYNAWSDWSKPGSLYKVDLPDEAVARMLDWDKPLSQQATIKQALQVAEDPNLRWANSWANPYFGESESFTGARLIDSLKSRGAVESATQAMRRAGIPGIRYLDGGSRGAGQGTSNYVVFPGNEDLLTILERNGIPIR